MFFCKVCKSDFDSVARKPMVIPCGHTFCNECIQQAFSLRQSFNCENCFYKLENLSLIFLNQILIDKTSFRQTASPLKSHQRSGVKQEDRERNLSRVSRERNTSRVRKIDFEQEDFESSLVFDR